MIAVLAASAWAWELCPEAPAVQLAAGADLLNLYPHSNPEGDWRGFDVERVDPGWSGAGWDQGVVVPVRRLGGCARAGLREQVVWHNVAEGLPWAESFPGSEWHFGTSALLGGELALPAWFAVGGYASPGVRAAWTRQRVDLPSRGLDARDSHLSFVPTLSAVVVVRWWASTSPVGLHVDAGMPLLNPFRETVWYPHRFLGLGADLRLGRAGTG